MFKPGSLEVVTQVTTPYFPKTCGSPVLLEYWEGAILVFFKFVLDHENKQFLCAYQVDMQGLITFWEGRDTSFLEVGFAMVKMRLFIIIFLLNAHAHAESTSKSAKRARPDDGTAPKAKVINIR